MSDQPLDIMAIRVTACAEFNLTDVSCQIENAALEVGQLDRGTILVGDPNAAYFQSAGGALP